MLTTALSPGASGSIIIGAVTGQVLPVTLRLKVSGTLPVLVTWSV